MLQTPANGSVPDRDGQHTFRGSTLPGLEGGRDALLLLRVRDMGQKMKIKKRGPGPRARRVLAGFMVHGVRTERKGKGGKDSIGECQGLLVWHDIYDESLLNVVCIRAHEAA